MVGEVLNINVCSPVKLRGGLTRNYHEICHYSYNLPVGLMNVGLVDQSIAPLWSDSENFEHQFTGIAMTVKYIPSQKKQVPE